MSGNDEILIVSDLIGRARRAQALFAEASQEEADFAALAAGWAILHPDRNRFLAEQAVADTGLGNVEDKIAKNRRKTLGLLRDLKGAVSVGVIREDGLTGITEIARPVGVVAAVTPSTNPVATPANNIINALKGRNAVILAPSPKGSRVCARLIGYVHAELAKAGLPADLIQMLPPPAGKALTGELMRQADLVVATGSRANVRAAYASGTPALGVGAGNVAAIVTTGVDPVTAARRIAISKTFDNATSCSSENSLVVLEEAWSPLLAALAGEGGVLATKDEADILAETLFRQGKPSPVCVARDAARIARLAGLDHAGYQQARFIMVDETGHAPGPDRPYSGEKLAPVLTLYRVPDFDAAIDQVARIYDHQGKGHSVGIHGGSPAEILRTGLELPVCRVIVDQVHCVATGGAEDNGLPVSLSMGCGTWGGNGFSDNLNYRHFLNITRIVRTIPPRPAAEEDILAEYWHRYGR